MTRDWLISGRYQPVVLGLEPTGIYHETWAYALQKDFGAHLDFRFLNPYQTKQRRKTLGGGRNDKTDAADLIAIAHCLRDGLGNPTWLRHGNELCFDLWSSTYRQVQSELFRLRLHLMTQLDRLWPGALVNVKAFQAAHPEMKPPEPLVLSRPLERRLIQVILAHESNPYRWINKSPAEIQTILRSHHLRCGPKTAQKVYSVVQNALFLPEEMAELLAERLQADFSHYQLLQARMGHLQQQAEDLVPQTPAAVLTTIPGISAFLAAQYLAYIINVQRFDHPDAIWKLAGFDVIRNDSGDRRRIGKISKRGDPGFRRVLFQIGLNTSVHCPALARAKNRALLNGKNSVGAILHAAHKANRICYHLLTHQIPFDPLEVQ